MLLSYRYGIVVAYMLNVLGYFVLINYFIASLRLYYNGTLIFTPLVVTLGDGFLIS